VFGICADVAPWAVLGVGNAGTVRLPEQADVTLCLDGDDAGQRAARAAVREFWRQGHKANVAAMPDGLDPLDLLRRQVS
jgi:DNA primase